MIKRLITRDKARNCLILSDLISTFIIGNVLWFTIYDNILYYMLVYHMCRKQRSLRKTANIYVTEKVNQTQLYTVYILHHMVVGTDCTECKFNYHTITATKTSFIRLYRRTPLVANQIQRASICLM
jgi:hypothetical protein